LPGDVSLNQIVDVFSCCILNFEAFTVMLPAFVLAGAITVFVPPTLLLRYFGASARKWVAYGAAAISGCVLSVCSCNIVPLFISIYRRGAGLGPAVTFLYAGPAINLVSLVFVFQVIGWRLGLWRALAVPIIAVIIGLIMALVFRREEQERVEQAAAASVAVEGHPRGRLAVFFILLVVVMLVGGLKQDHVWFMTWPPKLVAMGGLATIVGLLAGSWFEVDELKEWGIETWKLIKMVVPILLVSVLVIGYIAMVVKLPMLQRLGLTSQTGNSVQSALLVATFGSFMYFPILTEVAFTKAFLRLNDLPPALGLILLLTGSGLSLPGMILVARAIGVNKVAVYVVTLIILTALTGLIGYHVQLKYMCPCME
jgi:uncharacterized membrane protein YraQ (UPF0718 family)